MRLPGSDSGGSVAVPIVVVLPNFACTPLIIVTGQHPSDFKSKHDGRMHACGHDGHTAMLLGAAAVLKRRESEIKGTIRLIWQPAEEGGAGGKRMVEEGVLSMEPKPQAAFGFHQWPFLPLGSIGGRPGPMLAATELFDIVVSGVGGHAAMCATSVT